ncbi:hypothetical protein TRAPUB_11385 [Trametes pubescens]|uniref:Uncharacterized protein n=1 Tax=Trametes pubescens TaxID=154538 RepID=A0A1M2VWX0_TRAPU|nr:hypothetical protein TRAPUB_11385 [Trametes pubescens]
MAAFLDDAHVMFVGHDDKYLHIYNYYNAPSNLLSGNGLDTATLELVPPDTTWDILTISITAPSLAPNTSFCRLDPSQEIYVITLVVTTDGLENKQILIFIPRDPIVACAELVRRNEHPRHFGWEEWASGVQIIERSGCLPGPSYGISGSRIVLGRILEVDELELEFLEHDVEDTGTLTCRTTRTTRIHLPVQSFLVRSVAAWENGVVIETIQRTSMFVASLSGQS